MSIDYSQARQLSDGEQFVEVFRQLVKDKIKSVEYNAFGPITIYFKDGSNCGGMWLWKQAGLK